MKVGIVIKNFHTTVGINYAYIKFMKEAFEKVENIIYIDPILGSEEEIDLLILPGGADVNPERYKEAPHFYTHRPCSELEFFDKTYLQEYIENGTPIFGICRGLQTLNVHFGGTLHQHIHDNWYHKTSKDKQRGELVHKVEIMKECGIKYEKKKFEVNSLHHQAIKHVAEAFTVVVKSDDGYPEAIIHKDLPIAAVQWHPEELYSFEDGFKISQEVCQIILDKAWKKEELPV